MGIGSITIDDAGSATAPSSLKLTLPTPDAARFFPAGVMTATALETLRGLLWGNGHDQPHHIVSNVLKTGVLAPEAAPTVTPSGARATATLDLDVSVDGAYNPSNNDELLIGNFRTRFVTTLPSKLSYHRYILIGAAASDTLDNLQSAIEGVSGKGVVWDMASWITPLSSLMEVTSNTGTALALRALAWGAKGNNLSAMLYIGSWTDCSFGTGNKFTGGTAGTGSAPEAGSYDGWAYGYMRTEDSAFSALSPKTSDTIGADMNVTVAGMVSPDDADVDFIRVYRPIASGLSMKRAFDIDEDDTTESDTISNDTIVTRPKFDESLYLPFTGGYPPRGRCYTTHKGSVFTAGCRLSADYSRGTASVTVDDNEVTLTGAYPTTHWIGRMFRVSGGSLEYPISRVDAATKKLYLATDYEGSTDGTASYEVKDKRNPYLVHYAEPLLPNSWQETYSLKGVSSLSPDGVVASLDADGAQFMWTKTGVWSITGDGPGTYSPNLESSASGAAGPRAVEYDGKTLWWMSPDGDIWAWPGAGEPENLTRPDLFEGMAYGIARTVARINLRQIEEVVALYDPGERTITWFVALDDDVTNRHAIVLDLKSRTFTVDECEDVTEAAVVVDSTGIRHVLTGDVHGRIFEVGVGESDGAHGFEPVRTVTAATTRSITTATGLPTTGDGLAGVPVYLVSADGTFTRIKVASNTATAIVPTTFITAPVVGTQIVVGGILWDHETGRYHLGELRSRKGIPSITLNFTPQTRGQMWLAASTDQGTPALAGKEYEIDLSDTKGRKVVRPGTKGYLHKQRIVAVAPNFTPNFYGLTLEVDYLK